MHYSYYRTRRLPSDPIIGWQARLCRYFWPRPDVGYNANVAAILPLEAEGRSIALATRPWDVSTQERALKFAQDIFRWGGVPQKKVTAEQVDQVIQMALLTSFPAGAPMNSGWTKVAAIVTAHLEEEGRSQAIWDSRVAWSLVRRLDALLFEAGHEHVPPCFPHIGRVPGRGGTRWMTPLRLNWPYAYGRWDAHFAASALVREMRDELNRRGIMAPRPDGSDGPWAVRQVEMVLFMDGY